MQGLLLLLFLWFSYSFIIIRFCFLRTVEVRLTNEDIHLLVHSSIQVLRGEKNESSSSFVVEAALYCYSSPSWFYLFLFYISLRISALSMHQGSIRCDNVLATDPKPILTWHRLHWLSEHLYFIGNSHIMMHPWWGEDLNCAWLIFCVMRACFCRYCFNNILLPFMWEGSTHSTGLETLLVFGEFCWW